MPGDVVVSGSCAIPERELRWRFSRSSGPGGQSVNTSDTQVELNFDVARSTALTEPQRNRALQRLGHRLVDGVLTIRASEHRSQLRNREAARARLAATLRGAIAPPPPTRRPTRPSRGAELRRLDAKARRSRLKRQRQPPTE